VSIQGEETRRKVACPSCGAPVRFRGATSIVSVCAFCKSTLVREGVKLEDIGKQAELLEDHSPIRIGTDGRHRGVGFNVVGRIQFAYPDGVWNEWHVLFPGGKGAWLSDAGREYSITYLVPPQPVPPFEALKPGMQVRLAGDKAFAGAYSVSNLDVGEVVAGEGELPFRFTAGWKASVADLRGEGASFATIDYSEEPPHIYVGEKLPFDTFGFSGLRDPEQGGFTHGTALAFKCAGCGAPIEKRIATTEVVACGSCGSVTDVRGTIGEVVQKNELNLTKFQPPIPLGSTGTWKGVRYEVVGFMRRGDDDGGTLYQWSEYLLHNTAQGYAWITEYDGHYNFVRAAAEIPRREPGSLGTPSAIYLGRRFARFGGSYARVTFLSGEFYWRVRLGDVTECDDYVDPPLILSSEKTDKELTWSLGEYVDAPALWKAFGLKGKPRKPEGIAPNQPSPYKGRVARYWLAAFAFIALGLVAQLAFLGLQASARPASIPFNVAPNDPWHSVSAPLDIGGWGATPLVVRTSSDASREWLDVQYKLTNAQTGQAYGLNRAMGFRKLGAVVDGTSLDIAEIPAVEPGRYTLTIDAAAGQPVRGTVDLYRESVGWSNFFLFAGFVLLWPLVAALRSAAFETKRWSESDYAASAEGDDSGDSDDSDD
jgi:ribosomal protein L37AE/L43A